VNSLVVVKRERKSVGAACCLLVAGYLFGCASAEMPRKTTSLRSAAKADQQPARENEKQLATLLSARFGAPPDFPIGPGDVLQVSVPGVHELNERTTRVDEDGNISLPLVGTMRAAGLSEDGVRKELKARLGNYMYHPDLDLFVKTFSSRRAAVLGEVHNPGMYTLTGPADTVRELIQRAGGTTDTAAQQIFFTPSVSARSDEVRATNPHRRKGAHKKGVARSTSEPIGATVPVADLPNEAFDTSSSVLTAMVSPLVISMTSGGHENSYLGLPVLPGDTIYVPRAGEVTVSGWVYQPKVLSITPNLTVLGAVAAAGGPLYAGDMTSVRVMRQGDAGQLTAFKTNLEKVKDLDARDVPVQANDVIEVPYSTLRIPGYAFYYAAQGIVMWAPATVVTHGVP